MKRVLHVISGMDARYGGPTLTVSALARATAATGRFCNYVLDFASSDETPLYHHQDVLQYTTMPRSWSRFLFDSKLRARLNEILRSADVVQTHGLWKQHNSLAVLKAKAAGLPVVVSAHGMLQRWALQAKGWKKYPYWYLAERPLLSRVDCLRALTSAEVHDYRSIGLKVPIAVIPNGVDLPTLPSPELFRQEFHLPADRRIILFLGRVHPKKGVDILCEAWSRISGTHSDAHLVIAGPGEKTHIARIRALLDRHALASRVTMTGLLKGDMKLSALSSADCFVLPSHSEGLSVAVLEALAAALPVVISPACNQPEVEQEQCGLIVDSNPDAVAEAMQYLLRAPSRQVASMGARARELAERKYAWSAIGRQMADVYDWLLGGHRPGEFVYL